MASSNDAAFTSSADTEKFLCDLLLDSTQPISERFRALFSLRNLKGPAPRNALIHATRDSSNLLAHEAAFALGQMQETKAIPALASVLNDLSLHPIVRHEAAEALGAIGSDGNIPLLKSSLDLDPAQEVRETCELALHRIQHFKDAGNGDDSSAIDISPFKSVDPAAPASSCSSVQQLRGILLDEGKGMYERYAALFALRNDGGKEAVAAIIDSLGSKSALLFGWSGSKSNSNNNVGTIFINNKKLQHLYVSGHRKMLASGFDFTAILNHRQHQHQHQHHHHQHRHHHHLSHVPAHSERSETEIDPRYGVDKRLVPTGPNPLHH